MANPKGKVPVKLPVTRADGTTFEQTFWKSPEEAQRLRKEWAGRKTKEPVVKGKSQRVDRPQSGDTKAESKERDRLQREAENKPDKEWAERKVAGPKAPSANPGSESLANLQAAISSNLLTDEDLMKEATKLGQSIAEAGGSEDDLTEALNKLEYNEGQDQDRLHGELSLEAMSGFDMAPGRFNRDDLPVPSAGSKETLEIGDVEDYLGTLNPDAYIGTATSSNDGFVNGISDVTTDEKGRLVFKLSGTTLDPNGEEDAITDEVIVQKPTEKLNSLTVGELIQKLSKLPANTKMGSGDDTTGFVNAFSRIAGSAQGHVVFDMSGDILNPDED